MTDNIRNIPNFKSSPVWGDIDKLLNQPIILQHIAAVGDTNNDQLTNCRICSCNGWPHESITFHKVNGRALSSGGNEVKEWIIRDYFNKGNKHVHKQKRGGPR